MRSVVGHPLTTEVARAVLQAPVSRRTPVISADGTEEVDWAEFAEVSDVVDLSPWSPGTRAGDRSARGHPPGAHLTFTDVVGIIPMERAEATAFFQVVNRRCAVGNSTIVTTNRGLPAEWGEILGDPVVAAAILDC